MYMCVCVYVLYQSITVQCTWQAGHGKGRLLGKDDSCESLWSSSRIIVYKIIICENINFNVYIPLRKWQ